MKIIVPTFTFCLALLISARAQTSNGSWLVGGNINGAHQTHHSYYDSETKSATIAFTPRGGYFVINKLCAGIGVDISGSNIKSQSVFDDGNGNIVVGQTIKSTNRQIGVGPFVRYYLPISKLFILTEASYQPTLSRSKGPYFDPNSLILKERVVKETQHAFSVGAGPAFFIATNVSVELLLNYKRVNMGESETSQHTNRFYVSLGLQVYLPSKSE